MDLDEMGWILLLVLAIIEVVGWWATLFLWVIPTLSIGLSDILTLTIWSIVGIGLFFSVWLWLMVLGAIFLAGIIFS